MGRTKGSAPMLSISVNASNNRVTTSGYGYDNNGNLTAMPFLTMSYDAENRMSQATHSLNGTEHYSYSPTNLRVWKLKPPPCQGCVDEEVYFYGTDGEFLGTYGGGSGGTFGGDPWDVNVYFAGRQTWKENGMGGGPLLEDRLGETQSKYPYNAAPTYVDDPTTNLDYARNRYYSSTLARFTSPDPYQASGGPADPQSWNRYAYVQNDPVNANDPSGLQMCLAYAYSREGDLVGGYFGWCPSVSFGHASFAHLIGLDQMGPPSPGIRSAKNGLRTTSSGEFESKKPCRDFFEALIKEAGLDMDVDTLMGQVATTAGYAASHVYDGPSATRTALDTDRFPDAGSAGASTVSEWFAQVPGSIALSQFNGAAIWIRQGQWSGLLSQFGSAGSPNQYGLGTLMHELLHKQMVGGGFSHYPEVGQIENALRSIGRNPVNVSGQNGISRELGAICF